MSGSIFHYSGRDAAIYKASRRAARPAAHEPAAGPLPHQAVVRLTPAPGAEPGRVLAALRAHPQVRCCGLDAGGDLTARLAAPDRDGLRALVEGLAGAVPGVASVEAVAAYGRRYGRGPGEG